jgi:polyamine oxidase
MIEIIRTMMRQIVPLVVALLGLASPSRGDEDAPPIQVFVAIIGVGIGGLSAANEFQRAGMDDWVLLEAKNRLGGRFLTVFMKSEKGCPDRGCPIEIGQRYVQGIQGNPLYDLAKDIGFRMHQVNWNKMIVFDENTIEVKRPPFMEWEKAFTCAEELGDQLNQDPNAKTVIDGQFLLEQCGWKNETAVKNALQWLEMEFEYGCAPDQFAAYAFPEYTYVDFRPFDYFGDDADGFGKFISHLEDGLKPGKIRTGDKGTVTNIDTEMTQECPMDWFKLTTKNGKICAQYVISTIPFGAMKDKIGDFFPNVPENWNAVVEKFKMGNYHNTYLKFKKKFWQDTEFILSAKTGEPLDEPVFGFRPYDTGHPVRYWPGSNILQINTGGDEAKYFDELCLHNPEKLKEIIMKRLKSIYAEESIEIMDDPDDSFVCTWWSQDPLTGGAWFQYGHTATPADYNQFFKPQGNMFLSGEASCRNYYGFGHGALLAGWRDANKILQSMNDDSGTSYKVVPESRCEVGAVFRDRPMKPPSSKYFRTGNNGVGSNNPNKNSGGVSNNPNKKNAGNMNVRR